MSKMKDIATLEAENAELRRAIQDLDSRIRESDGYGILAFFGTNEASYKVFDGVVERRPVFEPDSCIEEMYSNDSVDESQFNPYLGHNDPEL